MKTQSSNVMDIDGVAEYTTLSKSTIYNRITKKTIPFHKIGSRTIFLQEEINEWIKNDGQIIGSIPALDFFNN